MNITDRRALLTAGLAGSVAFLALVVVLVVAALTGVYCW